MMDIRLPMIGKRDKNGDEFYVMSLDVPFTVDLSEVVLLVHPWEIEELDANGEQKFGAQITIRRKGNKDA